MSLVTTPFFNILLNESPSKVFQPSRGIRQGDPLSSFLFILMEEGMSCLIQTQAGNGELRGLKFHDRMDPQTHQQFVDDTMLMGNPSVQEARSFKRSLNLFAKASGLAFNANKSQVFFMNTTPIVQRNIARILGFSRGVMPLKYMGVPLGMGKLKKESWQEILDIMKQRLSSWVLRPLNLHSRLVLLKSVLQAMPIYLFSVFSAPKSVLCEIRFYGKEFSLGWLGGEG